jgi:hypothetical protein
MKKFEYKQVGIVAGRFEEMLNNLGKDGWELIVYSGGYAFLKREIPFVETKKTVKQLLQESYNHED